MKRTTLLVSVFVCLLAASPAIAQLTPLPERLCVNDPAHGRLEVNTITRTFRADMKGREYSGQLELFEPTSELEYIMLGGTVPSFRFFSNITYKRHASFARVQMEGQGFEMWNLQHLDCDGQPANVPPYEVHIYPRRVEGTAPLTVMLCAVPNDFTTLTTYMWSISGGQKTGNMIQATFAKPGVYRVRVDAKYIDIGASDEITVVVREPEVKDDDPSPAPNEPPTVQISADKLRVKPKKGVLTLNALAEDSDGEIQSVVWDFGDGTTGEGSTVHKTWRKKGSYVVTCRVKDDEGAEASASVTVMVLKKKAP